MTDHLKNVSSKRPLSPHLTIYRKQITSVLSILHRASGVVLLLGILVLTWWIVLSVYTSFNPDMIWWSFFSSWVGKTMLFGWSVALFYHLINGIKYLFWSVGMGMEIHQVKRAGLFVLAGTLLCTALSWYLALHK